jgi:hypothetical protein
MMTTSQRYEITEGGQELRNIVTTKAEALRYAAASAKWRKSVVVVRDAQGEFIKSFDGRK